MSMEGFNRFAARKVTETLAQKPQPFGSPQVIDSQVPV